MFPDSAFEELKGAGAFPSPSGVGMQIMLLAQRDDCTLDEVVAVLRSDPALTAKVLHLANSTLKDSSRPTGTVRDAVAQIGIPRLQGVVVGLSMVEANLEGWCVEFDYRAYWRGAIAAAVGAQVFAEETQTSNVLDAFTCAFLSGIGSLAMATVHPRAYAGILKAAGDNPKERAAREREVFALTSGQVSTGMIFDWGLPASHSQVMAALVEEDAPTLEDASSFRLIQAIEFGQLVGKLMLAPEAEQPGVWSELRSLADGNELGLDQVRSMWSRIEPRVRAWCTLIEVDYKSVLSSYELTERSDDLQANEQSQDRDPDATETVSAVQSDPSRTRILAVDDDPVSLRLLGKHLEKAGYDVITARDGSEAYQRVIDDDPHIVVTDWMMPELDGLGLCKKLRALPRGSRLYILILTGQAEEDMVVRAFDAGADDYVTKPFKPKLLLARIRGGQRVVELQQQIEEDQRVLREKNERQKVMAHNLRMAAMTDALTQLPNRRSAMKWLDEQWKRNGANLSVVMLDIDKFKLVNDEYGHDVGDVVLRETSAAITSVLRKGDECARMGGEEFLILSPGTDLDGAMHLAERVRARIEANLIKFGEFHRNVTISLGVAQRVSGMRNVDELLKVADEAVYVAKDTGRNRVISGSFDSGRRSA